MRICSGRMTYLIGGRDDADHYAESFLNVAEQLTNIYIPTNKDLRHDRKKRIERIRNAWLSVENLDEQISTVHPETGLFDHSRYYALYRTLDFEAAKKMSEEVNELLQKNGGAKNLQQGDRVKQYEITQTYPTLRDMRDIVNVYLFYHEMAWHTLNAPGGNPLKGSVDQEKYQKKSRYKRRLPWVLHIPQGLMDNRVYVPQERLDQDAQQKRNAEAH